MFAALHVHSEYSLSRSCIRIDALARKAQSLGYKALALTDHNTMGGLVEFYRACREHGLKPILGLELDLEDAAGCPGIVLLAENHAGYENLLKLASAAKPVKLDTLSRHTAGLVGMITAADPSPILGAYERLAQVFSPDCLFVELPVDEPRRMAAACKLAEMLPRHVLAKRPESLPPGSETIGRSSMCCEGREEVVPAVICLCWLPIRSARSAASGRRLSRMQN